MKIKDLKIGGVYWILTGMMVPIQAELTGFNNNKTAALFGPVIARINVYSSKKDAINGKY